MKTKFKLFSAFAAFACALASGFAWGEDAMMPVIENSNHQEWKYEVSRAVYDVGADNPTMFACVSNAVEDAESGDELNLLLPVKLAGTSVICIDKVLTLKIKPFEDLSRCQLIFRVSPGGRLTVANTGSFIGAFLVDGGELCLRGGTFYTDGVNPVVSSSQNDSEAKIEIDGAQILGKYQNATKFSQTPAAIDLGGDGSFAMCNGAKVAPYVYSSRYTNIFNTAINVHRGDVRLDNVSIVANDYALAIGYGDDYQGEGVFTVSNMTKLVSVRSGGVYARASTNSIDITLCDTTITSLDGGVKLDYNKGADIQTSMHKHTVEMDGSTTIRTQSLFGDYAIRDVSNCQYWDVDIRRGTYYRMRQSFGDGDETFLVTNKWVNPESVASWDPIDAEDNLTMIVTCDKEDEITVIFNGYGSYPAVKDGNTDLEKTQIGFNGTVTNTYYIPHGGSEPLALVTPESIGWTNSMGVFAGWYDSYDNARALKGALTAVPKSMTLYAGWRPCVVSFHHCIDEVVDYFTKTGLARRVVNDKVSIEDFKPATFGNYDNSGHSFVGWYLDKDYSGAAVTSLSVPVATNLYARWIEKSGVAWIEGTTNTYRTVAEAIDAAGGTNVIVLIDNVKDEAPIVVSNQVGIALNGFSLGDAGRAADNIFELAGTNAYLKIFGEEGTVYGTISVGDNAWLELEGGTYVCKEGMVISADGSKFNVLASDAVFKGPKGEVALDFAGPEGYAILSNSTVSCVESSGAVDIAINVENCKVGLVGSKVAAEYCGLMASNGVCTVEKSSISAMMGIMAYPSTIKVSDSAVTSTSANGNDEAYAFYLEAGPKGSNGCELELRGENTVVGGVYDTSRTHAFLKGGAFHYEGIWADALKGSISGGTYSHQMSNEVVMAWIATNCVCVWESETRFTVTDPNANYTIAYDLWTNLPKDAQTAVNEGTAILTNSNPEAYGASTKYLKFNDARCSGEDGYKCEFMGWYLSDGTNSDQVVAISNGCVVIKVNGKAKLTDITGSLLLVAKWGDWKVLPYSVYFASGVVVKEVDEEDPTFVTYHEVDLNDEEDRTANKVVLASGFPLDGLEYHAGEKSITLPSGITWEGHTLSGWALYDPDDITDPEYPPETTNVFAVGEIALSEFVDIDGNPLDGVTLHAVWDRGGDDDFNPTFDDMYNDERLATMTGGDTYVGYISNNGQVIGKIVVKLGTPNGDGTIKVSATVTINGQGSKSFRGKGEYHGSSVDVWLENEEDTLNLTLDSKTISGSYNGYDVIGGVNLFKGSEADKQRADEAMDPFVGEKWTFVFTTEDATTDLRKKEDGEFVSQDTEKDGQAFAWGYSYVTMEFKDKAKVKLTGRLANGKEVSATATAIVGDNMMCVPANCSVYSGRRAGGFGFTAYFKASGTPNGGSDDTNETEVATSGYTYQVAVDPESVGEWDSTMAKDMPFVATVSYSNCQQISAIDLSDSELLFCVDTERPGWYGSDKFTSWERGEIDVDWLPADPLLGFGYKQYVDAMDGALNVRGKAPKMKLVDGSYIVPGKNGTDYSGLKLKYDRKKGTFDGSFKAFSIRMDDEGESHLKKTKVSVHGTISGGRGFGFGRIKKIGSQPVTLENAAEGDRADAYDSTVVGADGASLDGQGDDDTEADGNTEEND